MLDEATETRVIGASPERCFEIAVDVENYGQWTADLKDAEVLERDEAGRPVLVEFRAAAMGRSTTYALRYDHSETPSRLSWVPRDRRHHEASRRLVSVRGRRWRAGPV